MEFTAFFGDFRKSVQNDFYKEKPLKSFWNLNQRQFSIPHTNSWLFNYSHICHWEIINSRSHQKRKILARVHQRSNETLMRVQCYVLFVSTYNLGTESCIFIEHLSIKEMASLYEIAMVWNPVIIEHFSTKCYVRNLVVQKCDNDNELE